MQPVDIDLAGFDVFQARDIASACEWGRHLLGAIVPLRSPSSTAVSFDIDDTLIDVSSSRPVAPVESLYKDCGGLGCERVVITARPERSKLASEKQLAQMDEQMPMRLYHMPDEYLVANAIQAYKHSRRRDIETFLDHEIALNLGDQWSDIFGSGRLMQQAEKLTNRDHTYVIVPKTRHTRKILQANASIKLPSS